MATVCPELTHEQELDQVIGHVGGDFQTWQRGVASEESATADVEGMELPFVPELGAGRPSDAAPAGINIESERLTSLMQPELVVVAANISGRICEKPKLL